MALIELDPAARLCKSTSGFPGDGGREPAGMVFSQSPPGVLVMWIGPPAPEEAISRNLVPPFDGFWIDRHGGN